MRQAPYLLALIIAVFSNMQTLAEEQDSRCRIERVGEIDISPSAENDRIIVSGDICRTDKIRIVIEKRDGTLIFDTTLSFRSMYSGYSEIPKEVTYRSDIESFAMGVTGILPATEQLYDIDYHIFIDIEKYERLRLSKAPAFALHNLPEGQTFVVYDEETGQVVTAISYGS